MLQKVGGCPRWPPPLLRAIVACRGAVCMKRIKAKTSAAERPKRRRAPRGGRPKVRRPNAAETAVAALAHEVRTPLTGILALGELLAASDLPERERCGPFTLKRAAEHLAQLTTLVVDGVKAKTGRLNPGASRFAPQRLAEAVASTLSARAVAQGLNAEGR